MQFTKSSALKIVLFGFAIGMVSQAQAQSSNELPMLRFWKGYKQDSAAMPTFLEKLNTLLIPQTIAVGAGKGLLSYLPIVPASSGKPSFVPDEVALVAYTSEKDYQQIRSTPLGQLYGPLHFSDGLFIQKRADGFTSRSLVATLYKGTVHFENPNGAAYVVGDAKIDWQKGAVAFMVFTNRSADETSAPDIAEGEADTSAFLQTAQSMLIETKLKSAIVAGDAYSVMSFLWFPTEDDRADALRSISEASSSQFSTSLTHLIEAQPIDKAKISDGSGLNIQFTR